MPRIRQTVLDTDDVRGLAEFYRVMFGLRYRPGDEQAAPGETPDWLVLLGPDGERQLAFQLVADLPRPHWPDGHPPQMMHLDTTVTDAAELEHQRLRALDLGATHLLDRSTDPHEPLHVLADPSGHPFCLFLSPDH